MNQSLTSRMMAEASYICRKLSGARARARAAGKQAFNAILATAGPDDVLIDLGANVGEYTVQMAATKARVFAFEPDPHAVGLLKQTLASLPNATVIDAAAGTEDGTAMLYRKSGFGRDPNRASKSSSLFAEKSNIDTESAVKVETRDLIGFMTELDQDIALIKMDIEGAEVPLMEALLDAPVASRIGAIFIESHERRLPHLAVRTAALKSRTKGLARPRVNWDWH